MSSRAAWRVAEWSEKLDGVRYAFGMCRGDPYSVALVVVHGGTNVPSIDAMRGPSATLSGFFMDNNASAWWGEWCAVEIKGTL